MTPISQDRESALNWVWTLQEFYFKLQNPLGGIGSAPWIALVNLRVKPWDGQSSPRSQSHHRARGTSLYDNRRTHWIQSRWNTSFAFDKHIYSSSGRIPQSLVPRNKSFLSIQLPPYSQSSKKQVKLQYRVGKKSCAGENKGLLAVKVAPLLNGKLLVSFLMTVTCHSP